MRHKRYDNWMMLGILMLAPAAAAQTTIEPASDPVIVAEGEFPTSVEFSVNSAAAIDNDGHIAVAYEIAESGGDNTHILEAFTPDGETARHEAPPFSESIAETPGVTVMPPNLFAVVRQLDPEDESAPDLAMDFLLLGDESSGSSGISEKAFGFNPAAQGAVGEALREALSEEGCESPTFNDIAGGNLGNFFVNVECKSKVFLVSFLVSLDQNLNATAEVLSVRQLSESPTASSKNNLGPPASDPVSAIGRRQDIGILAYFGRPPSGEFSSRVTLLELGNDPANQDVIQIDDPRPLGFPDGTLATCGFADRGHYWVAFVSQDGRAVAARVKDDVKKIVDLGPGFGAVDIACGPWGHAVATWADTESASGGLVRSVVLGPGGAILDSHDQQALSASQVEDPDDFRVSNDINAAGEVVVAWSDGSGGDQDEIAFRRLKVDGHFMIDGTLSGSHTSPLFDGEGFIFDIVEIDGTPTLLVYYFTYQPDGSGEQVWMVGSAPIEDNRAVAEVVTGSGATFGANFDPDDVTRTPAGTVTATFLSCGLVVVETESERFGDLGYIAQRLTNRPLEVDGQCGQGPVGTGQVDASQGGSHFTPSRDGEGFILDIVEIDGTPTLVAYYFTYQPDGSGDPAWMVGTGPIEGNSATVTMTIAEGATFGPDFDPADVARTEWGEITFTWQTCENVTVEYDGLWGEGSFNVEPLTPPLIGATGLCAP